MTNEFPKLGGTFSYPWCGQALFLNLVGVANILCPEIIPVLVLIKHVFAKVIGAGRRHSLLPSALIQAIDLTKYLRDIQIVY